MIQNLIFGKLMTSQVQGSLFYFTVAVFYNKIFVFAHFFSACRLSFHSPQTKPTLVAQSAFKY